MHSIHVCCLCACVTTCEAMHTLATAPAPQTLTLDASLVSRFSFGNRFSFFVSRFSSGQISTLQTGAWGLPGRGRRRGESGGTQDGLGTGVWGDSRDEAASAPSLGVGVGALACVVCVGAVLLLARGRRGAVRESLRQ